MIGYAILGLALALISITLVLAISITAFRLMRKLGLWDYPTPPREPNDHDGKEE